MEANMNKPVQTREEVLENEVRWLEEFVAKLNFENINLRNHIKQLEEQLKQKE